MCDFLSLMYTSVFVASPAVNSKFYKIFQDKVRVPDKVFIV
jgi:hypothetical protein